jgi:hypothetical protein
LDDLFSKNKGKGEGFKNAKKRVKSEKGETKSEK